MAQPRKQQTFTYLEPHSGGNDDAAASLLLETELSNLSLCRRLAPVWNYGLSRSSQPIGLQGLKPLFHTACKTMILLIAA